MRLASGLLCAILAATGSGAAWSNGLQLGMPSPVEGEPYICNPMDAVALWRHARRQGADPTRMRRVGFYLFGPEAVLSGLQADLEVLGFAVRPDLPPRSRIATIEAAIDEIWIRATLARLCEIGARRGVQITNWEIALPEREAINLPEPEADK